MLDAPASIPESALATQPASKQPVPKALSAQQNLDTQLKPQEDTQQVGSETIHTCSLQAGLRLLIVRVSAGVIHLLILFMMGVYIMQPSLRWNVCTVSFQCHIG